MQKTLSIANVEIGYVYVDLSILLYLAPVPAEKESAMLKWQPGITRYRFLCFG